jgi:F0F1-type ATP synthase assembly protein I
MIVWLVHAAPGKETNMNTQVNPQMNPQAPETPAQPQTPVQRRPDQRLIAGVVLIVFGMLMLLAPFTNSSILGLSILPILGVLFIVWGLLARLPGPMIPGGILTGLGLGILLSQYAFSSSTGETQGGIVLLGLGIGFLLIIPLAWIVSPVRHWWALIPGGILTFIGIALLIGGPALTVASILGRLWPIIPIAVGMFLIWRLLRKR